MALAQWVVLPLVGYLLAMVCNVGTGMIFDHHVMAGVDVLAYGAGILLIVGSIVAVLPSARDPWRSVNSWEALRAEVEEQLDSGRSPAGHWLAGARGKWREFREAEGRAQQLAGRARALLPNLPGPGGPGPRWGLAWWLHDVSGDRTRISWRSVALWARRDRWVVATTVSAVVTIVLAVAVPGPPPRASAAPSLWMAVTWALVVPLATVTGARGQLVYYARLHLEWEAAASSVDCALIRWERAARRLRRRRRLDVERRAVKQHVSAPVHPLLWRQRGEHVNNGVLRPRGAVGR